jgi:hypothetical protein
MTNSASYFDGGGCIFVFLALFFLGIGFACTGGYTEGGLLRWVFLAFSAIVFILGFISDEDFFMP